MPKYIIKRDGRIVEFDVTKIENAIIKAMNAVGANELKKVKKIAGLVEKDLEEKFVDDNPTVEQILETEKTVYEMIESRW